MKFKKTLTIFLALFIICTITIPALSSARSYYSSSHSSYSSSYRSSDRLDDTDETDGEDKIPDIFIIIFIVVGVLGPSELWRRWKKKQYEKDMQRRQEYCTNCKFTNIDDNNCIKCAIGAKFIPCTLCDDFNKKSKCNTCTCNDVRLKLKDMDNDPTYIPCRECTNTNNPTICESCPLDKNRLKL